MGFSTEGTEPFSGPDKDAPKDPLGKVSPKDQGDTKDWNYAATAPKQHYPVKGHDTYHDIPGDGIVPAY